MPNAAGKLVQRLALRVFGFERELCQLRLVLSYSRFLSVKVGGALSLIGHSGSDTLSIILPMRMGRLGGLLRADARK